MRALHTSVFLTPPLGIIHQVEWERQASREFGLEFDSIIYAPKGACDSEAAVSDSPELLRGDNLLVKTINWFLLRIYFYRWLERNESKYDIIILRYCVHDPLQLLYVMKTRKKILFVHHTLEYFELGIMQGWVGRVRSVIERIYGYFTLRFAAGIIGVTDEIAEHEKLRAMNPKLPSFVYPNGILFKEQNIIDDQRGEIPELLFVASSFAPWHGLDLLLTETLDIKAQFKLHLIGVVPEHLKVKYSSDDRIKFYGKLKSAEINQIATRCWVGLSSFSLDRLKMKEACTLKVREYLNQGLPVYANYKEVLPKGFKYYRQGECRIDLILAYANEMRSASRRDVALAAEPFIGKKKFVKELFSFLFEFQTKK